MVFDITKERESDFKVNMNRIWVHASLKDPQKRFKSPLPWDFWPNGVNYGFLSSRPAWNLEVRFLYVLAPGVLIVKMLVYRWWPLYSSIEHWFSKLVHCRVPSSAYFPVKKGFYGRPPKPSLLRWHKNQHLFKVDKVVVTPWNMT